MKQHHQKFCKNWNLWLLCYSGESLCLRIMKFYYLFLVLQSDRVNCCAINQMSKLGAMFAKQTEYLIWLLKANYFLNLFCYQKLIWPYYNLIFESVTSNMSRFTWQCLFNFLNIETQIFLCLTEQIRSVQAFA